MGLNDSFNKGTKITYITSLILLLCYFVMILLIGFTDIIPNSIVSLLIALFLLVLFYFSLFISFIFGLMDFIKNKVLRKKLIMIYLFIIFLNVLVFIIPCSIYKRYDSKLKDKAYDLFEVFEDNDNYIFLYNDLVKMDDKVSSFGKNSYMIYNHNNDLYICLEYNNRVVYGTSSDLRFSSFRNCDFSLNDTENSFVLESYIKKYLSSKYNLEDLEVGSNIVGQFCIDGSCVNGSGYIDNFTVYYNNQRYDAFAAFSNGSIVVTDNIEFNN